MILRNKATNQDHHARVVSLENKPLPRCNPQILLDNGWMLEPGAFSQWEIIEGRRFDYELAEAIGIEVRQGEAVL